MAWQFETKYEQNVPVAMYFFERRKREDGKKKPCFFTKRSVLLSYDRFYPLQSYDRECTSSSAVKQRDSRKASHVTQYNQSLSCESVAYGTVHHRWSNDYRIVQTSTHIVKEKEERRERRERNKKKKRR